MISFSLSGAAAWLNAGEIRQNFLKMKRDTEQQVIDSKYSDQTLLENMQRALKMSLLRYYSFCNYENIQLEDSSIEASEENPNMYYFQYEKFAGYYIFSRSPKQYLQVPTDEKVLLAPGATITRLNDPECNKKESTPQE